MIKVTKINIFYLDNDPTKCAQYHVDKHVVKMILEYAQLLSTAHRVLDGIEGIEKKYVEGSLPARFRNVKRWRLSDERDSKLYSATHTNHPSAVWVRQSAYNYYFLASLLNRLCEEYTFRYGKYHKVETSGLLNWLNNLPYNIIRNKPFTEPTQAMPKDCIVKGDSISSYRNYYNLNKTHLAKWSGKVNSRDEPTWFTPNVRYK